jgi:glycosyltransferase involved in cell wall biosynthesis
MAAPRTPRVGFVLEESLGHITHAKNLRELIPASLDAVFIDVPWSTGSWLDRAPVVRSNWTVRSGVRASRGIRKATRRTPLDALFIHTQVPSVLAQRWMSKIPTVVSVDATPLQYDELGESYAHGRGPDWLEAIKWRANRSSFKRARHIVTWSHWAKAGVVDGYGVDPEKVTVIPPGVDPTRWERATDRPGDGPLKVLFVGGDLRRKGGDLLVGVADALRADHPDLELHLVTGSQLESRPGLHVHHGLQPNSPELVRLYHDADVFCLPTLGDCLPMVLSEAGAASLPLISTDVGAIAEVVVQDSTGLLVPPGDAVALRSALERLVRDADLRRKLGQQAARHVETTFNAQTNARRLADLLASIASDPRAAR